MPGNLGTVAKELLGQFRVSAAAAGVLGVAVSAWLLIAWPGLSGNEYYRLDGSRIAIVVQNETEEIRLDFRQPVTVLRATLAPTGAQVDEPYIFPLSPAQSRVLAFEIPEELRALDSRLSIELESRPFTDISNLMIDERGVDFSDIDRVIPQRGNAFGVILLREPISDILLGINDTIANYVLAILVVVLALLISRLSILGFWLLRSDSAFECYLRKQPGGDSRDIHVMKAAFLVETRRYRFWKITGPAVGFLLTVTSLSAALHPSIQAAQDAYGFLSAVQVAVVSTAIGLTIRLTANFCYSLRESFLRRERELLLGKME